jgi:hypothetical protein
VPALAPLAVASAFEPVATRAFDPAPQRPPPLVAAPAWAAIAGAAIAGAYLPPSAVFAVAPDTARGRAPSTQPIPRKPTPSQAPARPAEAVAEPGRAPLLADIPIDAPDDVPTWLVAVGSAVTAVSFVLPWGENGMIGGGVDGGFFSSWGLANAANVAPLVAALIALWLQLAPGVRRTPVRTALVGLLLGGPLAGVAFVYAASPFGLGTGGVGVVAGAALLLAGGALALRPRHAPPGSAV